MSMWPGDRIKEDIRGREIQNNPYFFKEEGGQFGRLKMNEDQNH